MPDEQPLKEILAKDDLVVSVSESVRIGMRAYFSSYHISAAAQFARLSATIEGAHVGRSSFSFEHRGYVLGSIIESVAFLEAAVNELFSDAYDTHYAYLEPLDSATIKAIAEFWATDEFRKRSSMLVKFQLALFLAGKGQFDRGKAPYQDVDDLRKLRNELIHYEPEWVSNATSSAHRMTRRLKDRFPSNVLMKGAGNAYFPDHCLGYGCARWAVQSSLQFADDFHASMGTTPNYQRLRPELNLELPLGSVEPDCQ